jgi:hypothetical protein
MEILESIVPVAFAAAFVMIIIWLGCCARLFALLKVRQPEKYKQMGEPSVIMNNSIRNNMAFMRFLFRREDRALGDPGITRFTGFMFYYFFVVLAVYLFLVISIFMIAPTKPH